MKWFMIPLLVVVVTLSGWATAQAAPTSPEAEIQQLTAERDNLYQGLNMALFWQQALERQLREKQQRIDQLSERLALETAAHIAAQQAAIDAEAARNAAEAERLACEVALARQLAAEEAAQRSEAERMAAQAAEREKQRAVEEAVRRAAARQAAAAQKAEKRRQLLEEGRTVEMTANEARARGFMPKSSAEIASDDVIVRVNFKQVGKVIRVSWDVPGVDVQKLRFWPDKGYDPNGIHKGQTLAQYRECFRVLNKLPTNWVKKGLDTRLSADDTWRFCGPTLTLEELIAAVNMDAGKPMEQNSIAVVPARKVVAVPRPANVSQRTRVAQREAAVQKPAARFSREDMLQNLSPEQVKGVLSQVTGQPVSWDQVSVNVNAKTVSVNGTPVNNGQPVAPNVLAAAAKGVAAQHNASPQG